MLFIYPTANVLLVLSIATYHSLLLLTTSQPGQVHLLALERPLEALLQHRKLVAVLDTQVVYEFGAVGGAVAVRHFGRCLDHALVPSDGEPEAADGVLAAAELSPRALVAGLHDGSSGGGWC